MTAIIPTETSLTSASGRRAIGTVALVLLAHAGALLALATMKPVKLQMPEPPKPVEVRFIEVSKPKPPPPPKPEPPKPKVEPKPKEVKVVQEPPKLQPKPLPKPKPVLTTKAVSERPQAVVAPQPVAEPPKPVEPVPTSQPAPVPKTEPKVEPKPVPKPEPAPPATPQLVEGVSYVRQPPAVDFNDDDLRGQARTIRLKVLISATGKVDDVQVVASSGISSLDQRFVRAMKKATFTPYRVNGVAVPVYTMQPFELGLSGN